VGLVRGERLEVMAVRIWEETSQEAVPPEHSLPIEAALNIPFRSGDLPCCGVTEVERAVLASRLDHEVLLSEDG
jgi:hypothetical protein